MCRRCFRGDAIDAGIEQPGVFRGALLGSRCTWLNLAIGNGCTLFLIVACIGSGRSRP